MTKRTFFQALAVAATVAFAASCSKDYSAPDFTGSCIVVNQGNFSESNGSLSLYNSETGSMSNGIFEYVNRRNFAAILIDAVVAGSVGMVTCNSADKIEFFDAETFAALCAPIDTGLVSPRMIAVSGSKAYVSCWGAPDDMTAWVWTYSNAYLAEVDLNTNTKTRSIKCGNEAEGVYVKGGNLYVAVADGVEVYALPAVKLSKKITTSFTATARQIAEDKNGKLWVSFNSYGGEAIGFAVINPSTQSVEREIALAAFDSNGKFAMSKDKSQVLYAAPTYEEWTMVASDIHTINVDTYDKSSSPLIRGTSLSAIGVNPLNGDIYTADVEYASNNTLLIYDQNGTPKSTALVGIAPQKFVFY